MRSFLNKTLLDVFYYESEKNRIGILQKLVVDVNNHHRTHYLKQYTDVRISCLARSLAALVAYDLFNVSNNKIIIVATIIIEI